MVSIVLLFRFIWTVWRRKFYYNIIAYIFFLLVSLIARLSVDNQYILFLVSFYCFWLLIIFFKADLELSTNFFYKIHNIPRDKVLFVKLLIIAALLLLHGFTIGYFSIFDCQIYFFFGLFFYIIFHIERLILNQLLKWILLPLLIASSSLILFIINYFEFTTIAFWILSFVIIILEYRNFRYGAYNRV